MGINKNYELTKEVIKKISGSQNVVAVNSFFIEFMEGLEGGAFLSQIVYWSDRSNRKDGFFYKTNKEWKDELFLTPYSVKKYTDILVGKGFLEAVLKKANGAPTYHYKLNMDKLIEVLGDYTLEKHGLLKNEESIVKNSIMDYQNFNNGLLKNEEWIIKNSIMDYEKFNNGLLKNEESITEITTEITTETTTKITTERDLDADATEISRFVESKLNRSLSSMDGYNVEMLLEEFSKELIIAALERSSKAGNPILYAKKILKSWQANNMTSVEQIIKNEEWGKNNANKQQSNFGSSAGDSKTEYSDLSL